MFKTPEEFLYYLKRRYAAPFPPGLRDSRFDAITKSQLEEHGIKWNPGDNHIDLYDKIASGVFHEVVDCQDHNISFIINERVAVGVLETGLVNAFIAKGGEPLRDCSEQWAHDPSQQGNQAMGCRSESWYHLVLQP